MEPPSLLRILCALRGVAATPFPESWSATGRRGGDTAGVPGRDLCRPPDLLADPEVGADRQLVLAAQRPGGVDHRGTADRVGLLTHPDAEWDARAVREGDGDNAGAATATETGDQPSRLAALGVDVEALDLADRAAAELGQVGPEPAHRFGGRGARGL